MGTKKIRHEVFCSCKVLKQYFDKYPELSGSEIDKERALAENWRVLLFRNSDLAIDISREEAEEYFKKNELFKYLVKASQSGGSRLVYDKVFVDDCLKNKRFSEFTSPLFIQDQSNEDCEEIENSYGVLVMNYERMINKSDHIFKQPIFKINKTVDKNKSKNLISWKELKELKHTCNSIIIISNYLFKDENLFNENVIPMIETLLPQKLEKETFYLSFITHFDGDNSKKILEKRYNEILKNIKREYKIELSILDTTEPLKPIDHDREIISNYIWMKSGNDFTYFRGGKSVKETTLHYYSSFIKDVYEDDNSISSTISEIMQHLIERIKDIRDNHCKAIIGTGENKLFNTCVD